MNALRRRKEKQTMAHTADEFFRVAEMDDIADVAKAQITAEDAE